MAELKDPAIKLFGKTIQLPETPAAAECDGGVSADDDRRSSSDSLPAESNEDGVGTGEEGAAKLSSEGRTHDGRVEDGAEDGSQSMMSENQLDPHLSAQPKESGCVDSEADLAKDSKVEGDQEEKSNPQDKTLKKPDKILPCPRCNSMDTKFCYYNNYNVNQPRHFCKSCQRYWTAGGSMRNVAIGAGRRKNKNSASQCRNPDVAYHSQVDVPNGIFHPAQKSNGAVLSFGSDSPLCESMASVLNIADRKMHAGYQGTVDIKVAHPYGTVGNGNDDIGRPLPTLSSTPKKEVGRDVLAEKLIPNCQSFPLQIPPQMPSFPGASWPYPWVPVQWNPQTVPTAFCPPGFPMGFYPTVPYWGCPMPGGWSLPWINPPYTSLPTQTSGPNSPTLGKHSRDNSMPNPVNDSLEEPRKERVIESDPEKCLWVPKTLRIDDPKDAAKSSIWATLGIRDDTGDSPGASLFKTAFPPRGDEKTHITEASSVLQANPAALSRSMTFHERS